MTEYRGKMCPRLTGVVLATGKSELLAEVSCREDGCQLWWKCREPENDGAVDEAYFRSVYDPRD